MIGKDAQWAKKNSTGIVKQDASAVPATAVLVCVWLSQNKTVWNDANGNWHTVTNGIATIEER